MPEPGPSSSKQAKKSLHPPDASSTTFKSKLSKLNAEWGGQRKKCIEPKTTIKVVETLRAESISCLRKSELVSPETIDTLDENWEQLGTERVVKFFNLFLLYKEDQRFQKGDCPMAYLRGLIDSAVVTQRVVITDLMERMAGVTADLILASEATQTYKRSMATAEEAWREQSTLISKYISQTEAQIKGLSNILDNLKVAERSVVTPRKVEKESVYKDSVTTLRQFGEFYYQEEASGRIRVITTAVITKQIQAVLDQVQIFLSKHSDPKSITIVDPHHLATEFWRLRKAHPEKHPLTVVDWIVGSVEPPEEDTSEESS